MRQVNPIGAQFVIHKKLETAEKRAAEMGEEWEVGQLPSGDYVVIRKLKMWNET